MSIWTDEQGRIHVGIMVKGKRIHRSLPEGSTKSDAKQIEAELRKAAGRREVIIPGDPSMSMVMSLYMTHANTLRSPQTAKFHALRAGAWLDGKKASEAPQVARKMISDMTGHYRPATINRSLGTIKKALTLAYHADLIPTDYGDKITRLPENNRRNEYLSIQQVKNLADAASDQVRAAIWIALLTGCRRGEILKLLTTDIIGDRLRIQAGNTKTLRERWIPIIPALHPWLPYVPLKIGAEGLKTGFQRARIKVDMEHINFHDLRHSCASLLINMGTSLEVVRDVLGHTSVKTTERYAHLIIDRQKDALNGLSAAVLASVKTV